MSFTPFARRFGRGRVTPQQQIRRAAIETLEQRKLLSSDLSQT